MSAITATDVNKLRTMTGAGMMDCKKPLPRPMVILKAIEILRKRPEFLLPVQTQSRKDLYL